MSIFGKFYYKILVRMLFSRQFYIESELERPEHIAMGKRWPSLVEELEQNGFKTLKFSRRMQYFIYIGVKI